MKVIIIKGWNNGEYKIGASLICRTKLKFLFVVQL
ncbi:hypothetical protein SAMN06265348_1209 [Pedobacter westerhofensis]|uniref:Uncharacterized protein n=1 Tax=Pedobacter westerhofensis TaxID=425512 RepID=A0A521FSK4_9SPHI|nr:hypothetical protein SAMN06265348_1209 [Pedobacter westerhofensis]